MSGAEVLAPPGRVQLDWGRRFDLWFYNLGLACCAVEVVAAAERARAAGQAPARLAGGPAEANVMIVAGTLTDRLAPAVPRLYAELPTPRHVISFGACATCGGPYWDSPVVTKGVDQLVPVDLYVPGCPPRPEALLAALTTLHERLTGAE